MGDDVGAARRAMLQIEVEREERRERLARSKILSPLDFQEPHSPTEIVTVRVRDEVKREGGKARSERVEIAHHRRRKQDARVWEAIEAEDLEKAAIWIEMGYRYRVDGMLAVIQKYGKDIEQRGGGQSPEDRADFLQDVDIAYMAWIEKARDHKVRVPAVLDVLVMGLGLRETDRLYQARRGWSKANLLDGLRAFEDANRR